MQETQETQVRSLGQEDLLEKEETTYPSVLAWKIPWTEESGKLQSWGDKKSNKLSAHVHTSGSCSTTYICHSDVDSLCVLMPFKGLSLDAEYISGTSTFILHKLPHLRTYNTL